MEDGKKNPEGVLREQERAEWKLGNAEGCEDDVVSLRFGDLRLKLMPAPLPWGEGRADSTRHESLPSRPTWRALESERYPECC